MIFGFRFAQLPTRARVHPIAETNPTRGKRHFRADPVKTNLFLLPVLLAASLAAAPLVIAQRPPILNSLGERLENPLIKSFDGMTFEVIHTGGVSRIPWEKMPEDYRAGYTYDPRMGAREEAHREQQKMRDMKETQRRETSTIKDQMGLTQGRPLNPQTVSGGGNPIVQRLERTVAMPSQVHLKRLGGPNVILSIQQVNPFEVQYRLRRGNWQTVPLKSGIGEQLTLLFEDGAGCKIYFLDRTSRNPNEATLVFERQSATRPRPKGQLGPDGRSL